MALAVRLRKPVTSTVGALAIAVVVAGIAAGCDTERSTGGRPGELLDIEVTGAQRTGTDALDQQLGAARAAGEAWAGDPIQIVSRLIRPEAARDAVWAMSGSGERPNRYRVVVVVDGFSDDSVRGKRYETLLEQAPGGGWHIREASVSWRCWRGRTRAFGIEPCP